MPLSGHEADHLHMSVSRVGYSSYSRSQGHVVRRAAAAGGVLGARHDRLAAGRQRGDPASAAASQSVTNR